jgi:hypothetical protein
MKHTAKSTKTTKTTAAPAPDAPSFEEAVATVYRERGTSPADVVQSAEESLMLIINALEGNPDRIVTEAMMAQLLEIWNLMRVVGEELTRAEASDAGADTKEAAVLS